MPKIKRRHEAKLLAKAAIVFGQRQRIFTGQGLSRRELRKLECMNIVEKRLLRTDAGNYLYAWGVLRPILQGRIPATVDASIERPWPQVKQGFFYRLARKEKNYGTHKSRRKKA